MRSLTVNELLSVSGGTPPPEDVLTLQEMYENLQLAYYMGKSVGGPALGAATATALAVAQCGWNVGCAAL